MPHDENCINSTICVNLRKFVDNIEKIICVEHQAVAGAIRNTAQTAFKFLFFNTEGAKKAKMNAEKSNNFSHFSPLPHFPH